MQKVIEGMDPDGLRVVIVDDVVTSGRSVLKAVRLAKEAGAEIAAVVCLVDREQGGAEQIREEGVAFEAICTVGDIERFVGDPDLAGSSA